MCFSRKKADKKSGRKKPRAGDHEYAAAPDSEAVASETRPLTTNNEHETVGFHDLGHHSPASSSTVTADEMVYVTDVDDIESHSHSDVMHIPLDPMWLEDLGLRESHSKILLNPDNCLGDEIINATQCVLRSQFPNVAGLEDTVLVAAGQITLAGCNSSLAVQVVHDGPKEHWITVTTAGCSQGQLAVFCSLQQEPSADCLNQIAKFFNFSKVTFSVMNTRRMTGAVDCGLFALVYAQTVLSGTDPCNVVFDQSRMRAHLVQCLEQRQVSSFPAICYRTVRRPVVAKFTVKIDMPTCDQAVSSEQGNAAACDQSEDDFIKLPLLCLREIISHALRLDISCRSRFRLVCKYFKYAVDKEPLYRLYLNESVCSLLGLRYCHDPRMKCSSWITMNSLVRKAGKSSAVVQELRSAFRHPHWYKASLRLREAGFGWFEITNVSGL